MTLLWRAFWRLCFSAVPEYSAERMKHNEIPDGDAEAKSRQFRSLPLKMQMKIGAKHAKGSRHSVEVVAMSLHLLPQQLHLIRTSDRLRDVGISPSPVVCHLLAASQRAKNKRCAATVRCLRRIQSTERRGTVSPSSHSRNGRSPQRRWMLSATKCLTTVRDEFCVAPPQSRYEGILSVHCWTAALSGRDALRFSLFFHVICGKRFVTVTCASS